LQLALAVDGNRVYSSCPVCGAWWDATDAHSQKKTCSERCRQAKWRAEHPKPKGGEDK